MKRVTIILAIISLSVLSFVSCNWAKDKTKKAINKTGEVVGKTGSEFSSGVYEGVKKTFENKIIVSDILKKEGLEIGEVTIHSTDSTIDNILTVYMIFNDNLDKEIKVKVFDDRGNEYGRTSENVEGGKGHTKFIDFIFDKRTNIGNKGIIRIE